MAVRIDPATTDEESRLALVALSALTMRQMEVWRQAIGAVLGKSPDHDEIMIIGGVLTTSAEKLLRMKLPNQFHHLESPLPYELLTKCNHASIAATTGINRETVRRKVRRLQQKGILIREDKSLRLAHGILQLPVSREAVHIQLQALQRTISQLMRIGVLRQTPR